jgi:hypothetical protein
MGSYKGHIFYQLSHLYLLGLISSPATVKMKLVTKIENRPNKTIEFLVIPMSLVLAAAQKVD